MDDTSTSQKAPSRPGDSSSDARKVFFDKLREEIPEKDLETFQADPEFSHAVPLAIKKGDTAKTLDVPRANGYICASQRTLYSIVLGLNDINRWNNGAVVNWAASKTGYPTDAHAKYATYALAQAANDWNNCNIGVTFKWKGDVLAEAFFPNSDPLNSLFVYKGAFTEANLPFLRNVFLHELGNVLGLRHEFALEKEKTWKAVQFGRKNPLSVMSYTFPPNIHVWDKDDTKAFYDYKGRQIGDLTIVDWKPNN